MGDPTVLLGLPRVLHLEKAFADTPTFIDQFGTSNADNGFSIVTDSNSVYVSGSINGTSTGERDAFLRKYDTAGNVLWMRIFGTASFEYGGELAKDVSGIYIIGDTGGSLEGNLTGFRDAYIRKYDTSGNVLWTRQFGVANSFGETLAGGIAADATGVYMVGQTTGDFEGGGVPGGHASYIRKYDASGNVLWTRVFALSNFGTDQATTVSVDSSGGVYVAGETESSDGDSYIRKYDASGNVLWTRVFGDPSFESSLYVYDSSTDASGIFIVGEKVDFASASPVDDAFITKYDASGNVLWTRQFGTSANDSARGVRTDSTGAYVTGFTTGDLAGRIGSDDVFIRKYDASGNVLWTRQFGTTSSDWAYEIGLDSTGMYVTGFTAGNLGGTHLGEGDAYLAKFVKNIVPQEFTLNVASADLLGNPLKGMWATIRTPDGTLLKSGFTPLTFTGTSGTEYKVTVANYDGKVFSKWQDDNSTSKSRIINLASDTNLTAIYDTGDELRGFTSLTYTGTAEQPDLTVNALAIDGNKTLHMWTIIDPQSTNPSGTTTYKVYASNYQDKVFDHWSDNGSTDRVRTITIGEATTITAYYKAG